MFFPILFTYKSIGGHLSCFHILVNMNNASMFMVYLSTFFETLISILLATYAEVGLLDHMVVLLKNVFRRNLFTIFHSGCTF